MSEDKLLDDMYFGYPEDADLPGLKKLWLECYPGDDEFCSFYFNQYYKRERCVVLKRGDIIVCVAHFLYGKIYCGNSDAPVIYMYAGGTDKRYRKNGYFRLFNDLLRDYCTTNEYAAYVFTANDGLEQMYDNMNYKRTSTLNVTTIMPGRKNVVTRRGDLKKCSYGDFYAMRKAYVCRQHGGLLWDGPVMELLYEAFNVDGGIYTMDIDGRMYYVVVSDLPDEIFVRETDIYPGDIDRMAAALSAMYGDKKLRIYSRTGTVYGDYPYDVIYYGHGRLTDNRYPEELMKDIYINLIEE